jgi:hypothetical protein
MNDGAHLSQSRIQSSRILESLQQSVILLQSTLAPALHFELVHIANRFFLGPIPDMGLPDARKESSQKRFELGRSEGGLRYRPMS